MEVKGQHCHDLERKGEACGDSPGFKAEVRKSQTWSQGPSNQEDMGREACIPWVAKGKSKKRKPGVSPVSLQSEWGKAGGHTGEKWPCLGPGKPWLWANFSL